MQPKKILIVDDDSFLLDMYAMKFSQAGFAVDTAADASIAFQKIKTTGAPEVLLLDLVMPVMNGFELLEKLHEEHMADGIIKIILSNRGEEEDIKKGTQLGIQGYIIKANTTPNEVVEKVREATK